MKGVPSTEKTEVWVLYDDDNLYIAARLWESESGHREATEMRRDANTMFANDHFGVAFDSFYDRRNGYGMFANSHWRDARLVHHQRTAQQQLERHLGCANRRVRRGLDGRVPFSLPIVPLSRGRDDLGPELPAARQLEERDVVSGAGAGLLGTPGDVADVGGGDGGGTRDARQASEHRPEAVRARLGGRPTGARPSRYFNNPDGEVGFDLKWGIQQTLIADITVNTDFAQVEDDEQQVNLTRFSLLFPEKRDFFLEGADTFNFGEWLDRRAAAPAAAAECRAAARTRARRRCSSTAGASA